MPNWMALTMTCIGFLIGVLVLVPLVMPWTYTLMNKFGKGYLKAVDAYFDWCEKHGAISRQCED